MQMEEKYHKYCTVPDAEEGILEGVLKNLLTILVYQKQVIEIPVMGGAEYASTGRDTGQEISHAA